MPRKQVRSSARKEPMGILIHRGDVALARLDDASFSSSWDQLAARCRWTSVFQSRPFVDCWYRLHQSLYEPIIVEGRDSNGSLVGLLTLARRNPGRLLVGAGDFHAEYQVWLADDRDDDAFIGLAIDSLAAAFPNARLHLSYLPATTPVGWAVARQRWPSEILVRRVPHALIDLHDTSSVDRSLRKEHNRGKLERLRRQGPVELQQIVDVEELDAELDTIANLCDLRQGAVNLSLPFLGNPLKRPLHLEMMRRGLLHVSVLRVGTEIASAHLDVVNGDEVLIYTLAHSPFYARESPGYLHILLLARDLAARGGAFLDLSPGETYKLQFGNVRREAWSMTVIFDRVDRFRADSGRRIATAGRSLLNALGQTRSTTVEKVAGLRATRSSLVSALAHRVTTRDEATSILQLPHAVASDGPSHFRKNHLGDLLSFRPTGGDQATIYGYLSLALRRLQDGHWAFTRMDKSGLAECWWVRVPGTAPALEANGSPGDLAVGAGMLIYDWLPREDASRADASLEMLCNDLARIATGMGVELLVAVPDHASHLARLVQDRGAVPLGRIIHVGRRRPTEVRYLPADGGAAPIAFSASVLRTLQSCLPAFSTWR